MDHKLRRLKLACYTGNATMSVVASLSPVLFLTFRSLYGISYSMLGLLVLINYVTQLLIDLVFSFFSHRFNIPKTLRLMPIMAVLGFGLYAISPWLFPRHTYLGLVLGTILFCASSGLAEVLLSPVIAAIPAEDPDREMSKLHSVFAWSSVGVILVGTLFLLAFGNESWPFLALLFLIIPLASAILFSGAEIPKMETPQRVSGALAYFKNKWLWLSILAIFLGGAAECSMSQWSSGYLEQALGIPKVWGDVFGVALFSVALGLGRTLYAKFGKNLGKVITLGAVGAAICYLICTISPWPAIGLLACALTGFCTSMLWPGNLVLASDRFPTGGVFIFAMMAAGGDLGASVAPQLIGIITDTAMANPNIADLATQLDLAPEQLAMKLGMLVAMLFPLAAIPLYRHIWKQSARQSLPCARGGGKNL
ncbi:MAG: MFS transporter [Oscillospiraceae bacterium]|nr:MFS transporter [Oscillospiraceae bacterium]